MMTPETLKRLLGERPFQPIELHVVSGQTYVIKHPQSVAFGKEIFVILDPETEFTECLTFADVTEALPLLSNAV